MLKLQFPEIMKRPTRPPFEVPTNVLATASVEQNEAREVGTFLDAIILRLTTLPSDTCESIRGELRAHLESLIAAHEELGATRDEAIVAAIHQIGEPSVIARRFRKAWHSTAAYQNPLAAMRIGLVGFGAAAALLLAIMMAVMSRLQLESGRLDPVPPVLVTLLVCF